MKLLAFEQPPGAQRAVGSARQRVVSASLPGAAAARAAATAIAATASRIAREPHLSASNRLGSTAQAKSIASVLRMPS